MKDLKKIAFLTGINSTIDNLFTILIGGKDSKVINPKDNSVYETLDEALKSESDVSKSENMEHNILESPDAMIKSVERQKLLKWPCL